jgi:hypothetical protein
MKQILLLITILSATIFSCNTTQGIANIEPKKGTMLLPAKGEFRIWDNKKHGSFSVTLTNSSASQSCELYTVNSNGKEKWVNPSLLANSELAITIPADGRLFIKNFNENTLPITYIITE